ncbi:hypothetical protein [Halocola ammonii]
MHNILYILILYLPFSVVPSSELDKEEKTLPGKFKTVDINNDNVIQTYEVDRAIERFFTGDTRLSDEVIDDLIDYYFEQ